MMLGIMTRVLCRPGIDAVAEAVSSYGLNAVQLNLQSAGLASLPDELPVETACAIGSAFKSRGLEVSAVSGSFNSIHPDAGVRNEGVRRIALLSSRCRWLGTSIITVCTGRRDAENMWRRHPANDDPEAWRDLVDTIHHLLEATAPSEVTLAFEPETANVVNSAAKARRLIEEIASPRLRVVLDPANLVSPEGLGDTAGVIERAFQHLSPYIVLAHAKDVAAPLPGDEDCRRVSAGKGVLDYRLYLKFLQSSGYEGALILHDLEEHEIPGCRELIRRRFAAGRS